jgi:chitodextrinase
MVFSSYGTGAQPLIQVSAALSPMGVGAQYGYVADNIAVVDIDFYAYLRDPSGPNTEAGLVVIGAWWNNASQNWILIEGCKFRFFYDGVNTNVTNTNTLPQHSIQTLIFRRNIVVDNHPGSGFGTADTTNFIMDENLFDHNYVGTQRGNQQHNFYIAGYYPDGSSVTPNTGLTAYAASARGNISTRDPSGSHLRSGGTIIDNLFAYNEWPVDVGSPKGTPTTLVQYNVVLTPNLFPGDPGVVGLTTLNSGGGAWYNYDTYDFGAIIFDHNIIAHSSVATNGAGGIQIGGGQFPFTRVTVSNNIVDDFQSGGVQIYDPSGLNTITGNWTRAKGGSWTPNAPPGLIDDKRTIETYDSVVLGGPGTFDHFIGLARQQSKNNWNPALTATAVNNYIRAGYGMSSPTPTPTPSTPAPTPDITPPSVPGGLAATAVSDTQVNVSWTASTDNAGVAGYKVFRDGVQVGNTFSTSIQDTGLSGGTAYTYTVSAYDAAGNTSAQSSTASVTTPASPASGTTPAPVSLSVTVNSPANGVLVKGNGSVNIAVSSTDSVSLAISADGNILATCPNANSCSVTWQGKKISQGTHTIAGTAVDAKGNSKKASVLITAVK